MTSAILVQVVIGALVALSSSLAGYLVVRRTSSGRIATSEAKTLWDASEQIRLELRQEVLTLRQQVAHLEKRVAECEKREREWERRGVKRHDDS